MSYDFSKHKKKKEELVVATNPISATLLKTIAEGKIPTTPVTAAVIEEAAAKSRGATPDFIITESISETTEELLGVDLIVIQEALHYYQAKGTHIIRRDTINPLIAYFSRLAYLCQQKEVWQQMEQHGLIKQTRNRGQFKIA